MFATAQSASAQNTSWNGTVSNDWNNSSNWSNGVPDSTTNVTIGSATFRPQVPTTGATTFNITVNNGGYLEWESCGGVLDIYGTLMVVNGGTVDLGNCSPPNQMIFHGNFQVNNGGDILAGNGIIDLKGSSWTNNPGSSFDAGTGTVIVDGTGDQTFSGDITFYDLIIDNPDATVTFEDDVSVENDLTVEGGSTVDFQGSLSVEGDITGTFNTGNPYIASVVASTLTLVDVTFSEDVNQTTAETSSNYTVLPSSGPAISVTSATRDATDFSIVHLTVSPALTEGVEDTLVVNNVTDIGGTAIQPNSRKRFTPATATPTFYSRASGDWDDVNTWSTTGHAGSAAARVPGSSAGDIAIIGDNDAVTLDINLTNLDQITVDATGTLNTDIFTISGDGSFELATGGTLGIGSADGITSSGATGNIQVTGTRTFSTGASYVYNGASAQVTGNGLPATVNHLTLSNASGVTLSASTSPSGDLTVSAGTFSLGTFTANRTTSGGTLLVSTGATLSLGGSSGGLTGSNFPADFTTNTLNGTVEYTGAGAQTVATLSYTNILFSNSGTKTVDGTITFSGNFTVNSGATVYVASTGVLQIGGALTVTTGFTNDGAITVGN